MRTQLCFVIAAVSFGLGMTCIPQHKKDEMNSIISIAPIGYDYPNSTFDIESTKMMLRKNAPTLTPMATQKVLTAIECAHNYQIDQNPILAIIDYSIPSSEKRLWIFNIKTQELLFHTYVSHGIKSGELLTTFFSNRYNSKSSSIGIYLTNNAYRGREGLSLRLTGLDRGFNDNAENRAIVMHGGWYMNESFIEKYGRPGRSWGCPAVPLELAESIINTIKNQALFVVYYPNESWFQSSKFLNCTTPSVSKTESPQNIVQNPEVRDDVFFANMKIKYAETAPIMTMKATQYQATFHEKAPLGRMLRRQINQTEYVALSERELQRLMSELKSPDIYQNIAFVVPNIKMERGYYITEMKILELGHVTDIQSKAHESSGTPAQYTVYFDKKSPITLHQSNQFIRWLGL